MLKLLMNSYRKTWHLWHTGRYDGKGEPGHPLPLGEPMLIWSFNRDGEMDESLLLSRDEGLNISSYDKRRYRQDLLSEAHPQEGVDALKDHFPSAAPIPGVVDKKK